jgi:hypothetical protein
MPPAEALNHYSILTAMLAPALLMAATGSLLISANNRLARVVDRLRVLLALRHRADARDSAALERQIQRHRRRSNYVLRACMMLYAGLGAFVGTSLALAIDALSGYRLAGLPTVLGVLGVLCLLVASAYLSLEVRLAVHSFDEELDHELGKRSD